MCQTFYITQALQVQYQSEREMNRRTAVTMQYYAKGEICYTHEIEGKVAHLAIRAPEKRALKLG